MDDGGCLDSFPWWAIVACNLVSLGIYGLGAYIVYQVGWIFMAVYLAFILAMEVRLLAGHCVHCCYYGRACAFGRGKLSALFFKRGDPARFAGLVVSWRTLLPDMLVSLLPLAAGVVALVDDFSWWVLAAMIALLALSTMGNAAVRTNIACKRCRQRELGCPAEKLFQKSGDTDSCSKESA